MKQLSRNVFFLYITYIKQDPWDPSLCRKTILETIKSLSISDYYGCLFIHLEKKLQLFSEIRLHRMSFILLVKILLSEEDCQALLKQSLQKKLWQKNGAIQSWPLRYMANDRVKTICQTFKFALWSALHCTTFIYCIGNITWIGNCRWQSLYLPDQVLPGLFYKHLNHKP